MPPVEHQFRPGESGNPRGRPAGSVSIVRRLEQRLRSAASDGKREIVDALVEAMLRAMLRDPVRAWPLLKDLIDRIDGPIPRPVQLSGPDGGPLQVSQPDYAAFEARLLRMVEAAEAKRGAGK